MLVSGRQVRLIIPLNFSLNRWLTKAYTIGLTAELSKSIMELACHDRDAREV